MFERFSPQARSAVIGAQTHARRLGSPSLTPAHLLLALADDPTCSAVLGEAGLDVVRLESAVRARGGDDLDAEALTSLGIDLATVRTRAEETFGAGALDAPPGRPRRGRHVPFTVEAKKSLELSLREAIRLGDRRIDAVHVLLGVVRADGPRGVLRQAGVDPDAVRVAAERGRPAA